MFFLIYDLKDFYPLHFKTSLASKSVVVAYSPSSPPPPPTPKKEKNRKLQKKINNRQTNQSSHNKAVICESNVHNQCVYFSPVCIDKEIHDIHVSITLVKSEHRCDHK